MSPPTPGSRPAALRSAPALALLFALIASPALAQGTGRSLDIQPGGRQNGMGAAGVALFGQPSDALWWNPAMLGLADRISVQGNYAQLVPGLASDVNYYHAAAAIPVGPFGIGGSYTRVRYGGTTGTDTSGFPIRFTSHESSPAVALGVRLLPGLAIGGTIKWIDIELAPGFGGSTRAYDLGAVLRVPADPLTLGLGVNWQNQGGNVTFVNEDVSSPLSENLKYGASAALDFDLGPEMSMGVVLAYDHNESQVTSEFETSHGGIEVSIGETDRYRVAGRFGYYSDPLGDIGDVTFGLGFRALRFGLDAGWIPQARDSDLDRVLKLTAGVNFPFPRPGDEGLAMWSRSRRSR